MFVLPPPPRYPAQMMYGGAYPGGQIVPMIETNNILSNPAGPDCQFLVGEGLYVLEDDLLLATPPPHPSEAPVININPLATNPVPATAGTRLSIVSIADPPRPRALSLLLASSRAHGVIRSPPASVPLLPAATALTATATATATTAAASSAEDLPQPSESSEAGGTGTGTGTGTSSQQTDSTGRPSFHTTSAVSGGGASDSALTSGPSGESLAQTAALTTTTSATSASSPPSAPGLASTLAAGFGSVAPKAAGAKQRKPKNSMTKSNSSFISRVIVSENLTKRLQDRALDGLFGFANINRAFQWLDLASEKKADYLTKVLFTKAHCLCHDINPLTKSTTHIDMIMGFSTGEVIWWEPISQRYTRLNKNGIIRATPVSEIRWVPGSENLFMAAFMDGSLVVFDKEKEDAAFAVDEDEASRQRSQPPQIQVERSLHATSLKTNPVAFWKLSNQRINAFAFAPGQPLLAVVSEDGSLRILDYMREELLDIFYSYYGGLTCVCWSPDDKYVVTGGQDDLLSIWSVADAALAARCQGHHSWVTSVAFDPWRCDERNYRFGSVGEDCRLCLWDFSMSMLIRPKPKPKPKPTAASSDTTATATASTSASASASASAATTAAAAAAAASRQTARPPLPEKSDENVSANTDSNSKDTTADGHDTAEAEKVPSIDPVDPVDHADHVDDRVHLVEPRGRTALLPPVCSQVVGKEPLCWLGFTERSIITSGKTGHIRTWKRPADNSAKTNRDAMSRV